MSEGFGWVSRPSVDGLAGPYKVWPREVRFKCGKKEILKRFIPDNWYDNGPYTIVAWRPCS